MITYFITALHNLSVTKLRTFLAVLGILVGTAAVVAMVSSGALATRQALAQFKNLGTDMLSVSIYGGKTVIELPAILTLPQKIPAITHIAPYVFLYLPTTYGDVTAQNSTIGATETLQTVIKIKMSKGRFISDLDGYNTYCVIGKKIYEQLQATMGNPIGRQIKLGNVYFTIVGVADNWQENSFFNADINNSFIVPIKTASLLSKYAKINNIVMRLTEQADIDQTEAQIKQALSGAAADQNIFFRSAKEIINNMTNQHKIFTWLLGAIGGVSLVVGGIGVMNIMLVSVLERRREIGIRLALGARRRDIQQMFLSEAILLAMTGGLLGVILGIIITFIIAQFAHWQFKILLLPPLIGFTVSVLTGIFFGFYPALQAAKLNPIETLRIE